jgi:hypothetical protein
VRYVDKVSGVLRKVWKRKGMSKDAKRSMHVDAVVSTLLYMYVSEVWATSVQDRWMGMREMKCMGYMCGVRIMDRVRNEEVHRRCGSEVLVNNKWIAMC